MQLSIPLPPPLNATYKMGKGHYYKSKEVREWEEEAGWAIKTHHKIYKMRSGDLYVGLIMYLKTDRDIDSSIKTVLDLLQSLKIYENDRQIKHLNVQKFIDKKRPRMEIDLEDLKV